MRLFFVFFSGITSLKMASAFLFELLRRKKSSFNLKNNKLINTTLLYHLLHQMFFLCLTYCHTLWNVFIRMFPLMVMLIVVYPNIGHTIFHWTSNEAIGTGICLFIEFFRFPIVKIKGAVGTIYT